MGLYQTTRIHERLYCIKEVNSTNLYLLLGDHHALLIDTGYGYGDILAQVRAVSDLPLLVALTHGDPDHGLGSYRFSDVYVHPADLAALHENDNADAKRGFIDYRETKITQIRSLMDVEAYVHSTLAHTRFLPLQEGDVLDLGGLSLRIIEIPGHSKGSVAFYEERQGWLFTGDTITSYNIWNLKALYTHCDPLSVLMRSYTKIEQMGKAAIQEIYPAHGGYPLTFDVIAQLKDSVRDLLVHHQGDEEVHTFAGDGYRHVYLGYILLYTKEMLEEALENGIE